MNSVALNTPDAANKLAEAAQGLPEPNHTA